MQNVLADYATQFLSKELQAKVEIDEIDLVFFDRVDVQGLYLEDLKGDTLGFIKSLDVEIGDFNIKEKYFYLDHVKITDPSFRLMKYKGEEDLNLKFLIDYFKKPDPDTTKTRFDFRVHNLELADGRFVMWDENLPVNEKGIDFSHLTLHSIQSKFENFRLDLDSFFLDINQLSAKERSGFDLTNLRAKAKFSPKGLELNNVQILTPKSDIRSDKLHMLTKSYDDYKDYINQVKYDGKLNDSKISVEDIAFFAPVLWGSSEIIDIHSQVAGEVIKMKFRGLEVGLGDRTSFAADFDMPKFTMFSQSDLFVELDYLNSDFTDIENFEIPTQWNENPLSFNDQIKSLGKLNLTNVSIKGNMDEFILNADNVKTDIGSFDIKNGLKFVYDHDKKEYVFGKDPSTTYDLQVKDFNLGKFLSNDMFGKISGKIMVSGEGLDPKKLNIDLGGEIDKFEFNNYTYQNIKLKGGKLTSKSFTGNLDIKDKNLDMHFDGSVDYTNNQSADFSLDVKKANLSKLGFTSRDSMELSFKSKLNITSFDPDKIDGKIAFYNILLKDGDEEFVSDSLVLNIDRSEEKDEFLAQSDLFTAKLVGKLHAKTIAGTMMHQLTSVFPSFFSDKYVNEKEESDFKYNILISNKTNDLFDIFVPGLHLSSKSRILGNYHGDKDEFDLFVLADTVFYKEYTAYKIDLYNQIGDSSLFIDNQIGKIQINDSLSFDNIVLSSTGENDTLKTLLKWGDVADLSTHPGVIHFNADVKSKDSFELDMGHSFFYMNKARWNVSDLSKMRWYDKTLEFEKVKFSYKDQYISINGRLSEKQKDSLLIVVNLENFHKNQPFLNIDLNVLILVFWLHC